VERDFLSQIVFSSVNEERLWHGRLEDAKSRLESAKGRLRRVETDQWSGRIPSSSVDEYLDAHDHAVQAQAHAQKECVRILGIYRALVLDGEIPGQKAKVL
jgi:hypothetical protein